MTTLEERIQTRAYYISEKNPNQSGDQNYAQAKEIQTRQEEIKKLNPRCTICYQRETIDDWVCLQCAHFVHQKWLDAADDKLFCPDCLLHFKINTLSESQEDIFFIKDNQYQTTQEEKTTEDLEATFPRSFKFLQEMNRTDDQLMNEEFFRPSPNIMSRPLTPPFLENNPSLSQSLRSDLSLEEDDHFIMYNNFNNPQMDYDSDDDFPPLESMSDNGRS